MEKPRRPDLLLKGKPLYIPQTPTSAVISVSQYDVIAKERKCNLENSAVLIEKKNIFLHRNIMWAVGGNISN